jgi:ribosomal RNA-processing protein 17
MSGAGPSNVAVLTHEKKIWLAKKRQKKEQVKEIIFDEDNRRLVPIQPLALKYDAPSY